MTMLDQQQKQKLSLLHREASAFAEGRKAHFKGIINTAFQLNIIDATQLRQVFKVEEPKIHSWRKGGASSIREARAISRYIAECAKLKI